MAGGLRVHVVDRHLDFIDGWMQCVLGCTWPVIDALFLPVYHSLVLEKYIFCTCVRLHVRLHAGDGNSAEGYIAIQALHVELD